MRTIGRWTAAAAGLALGAAVAVAQERGKGTEGLPGRSPSGQAATSSPGATGVGGDMGALPNDCSHKMTGTVKQIDRAAGTVSIDVAGTESIELKLPPAELSGFEEGDQVVVSMGIHESRGGAPEPDAGDPGR